MKRSIMGVWIVALLLASCTNSSSHSDGSKPAQQAAAVPSLAGWTALETNGQGAPAKWSALADTTGQALIRVESANREQTFNVLLLEQTQGPDLALAARLHADAGKLDQGGGLVWRAKDANNYYVARWDPLASDVCAYFVRDGIRRQLLSVGVQLDAGAWHDMQVRMVGPHITVALDKNEFISFDDATFTDAGKIGLWTKSDASTTFSVPQVETLGR